MATYRDYGYDGFLTKPALTATRMSPIEAKNNLPPGSLSSTAIASPLSATTDITFSSTDNDTASWTAGTIKFADGTTSPQVSTGNTGNIGAATYIYYDKDDPGELQTSTDHADACGPTQYMLAVVEAGASGKDCKITPTVAAGLIVSGITADQIAANTVTASEVAANTITANEIAANTVTASEIASNTITASEIDSNTITASEISAGTITGTEISGTQLDVVAANTGTLDVDEEITVGGDSNIKIDGNNKRIIINDGSNDRILIGYQSGGF